MDLKNNKGFTLIELLVVIAIISLLASVVLASLNSARAKARDAVRKSDLHQLSTAINLYYNDKNHLPRNVSGWCTTIANPTGNWGPDFQTDLAPSYISKVPLDPQAANFTSPPDIGDYFYSNDNNSQGKFTLCAQLETVTGQSFNQYVGCANWQTYNYCVSQ